MSDEEDFHECEEFAVISEDSYNMIMMCGSGGAVDKYRQRVKNGTLKIIPIPIEEEEFHECEELKQLKQEDVDIDDIDLYRRNIFTTCDELIEKDCDLGYTEIRKFLDEAEGRHLLFGRQMVKRKIVDLILKKHREIYLVGVFISGLGLTIPEDHTYSYFQAFVKIQFKITKSEFMDLCKSIFARLSNNAIPVISRRELDFENDDDISHAISIIKHRDLFEVITEYDDLFTHLLSHGLYNTGLYKEKEKHKWYVFEDLYESEHDHGHERSFKYLNLAERFNSYSDDEYPLLVARSEISIKHIIARED